MKPTVDGTEDGVYVIKYTLKNLGEGTYETRCRSQNLHGWSEYTDVTVVEVGKEAKIQSFFGCFNAVFIFHTH